jgi:hypothetical protein
MAQKVITHFNYRDFTKDVLKELCALPEVFLKNGSIENREVPNLVPISPIKINSVVGLFLRIKAKIRNR